jgi:O-6-methylguanine DNA methyltransferase
MRQMAIGAVAAPWGPLWVAATERGVAGLEQLVSREDLIAHLERRFGAVEITNSGASIDQLARAVAAVESFIGGDLSALDGLAVDLDDRPAWDRGVLAAVREIPPGSTASYGDVARMVGRPGAARAVGGAVGRNPIGLVVPCHRVIAGDGSLGGYGGGWWAGRQAGLELKRRLLSREGVRVPGAAGKD